MAWFQFGTDTYVVVDDTVGTNTFVSGTDSVVKLTGLVDLTTATNSAADVLTLA